LLVKGVTSITSERWDKAAPASAPVITSTRYSM
jgi:hypothetical protein